MSTPYPIGTPGTPWTDAEKQQWLSVQNKQRDVNELVLSRLSDLPSSMLSLEYGKLNYADQRFSLQIVAPAKPNPALPNVLVTGGVHGYETSGVLGALSFALEHADAYLSSFNLYVVPCVSPWGFQTINRWNPAAIDPNRSFSEPSPAPEAGQLMQWVKQQGLSFLAHFDLHETTDTDNSEFRPALAARDGSTHDNWNIPDGFYLVGDTLNPQADFQKAIIDSVEQVTHIAPPDENGKIIGAKLEQHGVINYRKSALGLCGGFTDANYVTTTEVYPDSEQATPQNCIDAQIAAIRGGLDYLQNNSGR